MEVQLVFTIINVLKEHMSDSLVVFCVLFLTFYQIREKRFLRRNIPTNHISYLNTNILKLVKNSACINKQLSSLLYKLGADRAWVYVFHNSGSDMMGQPFAKVTNTNEVTSPGMRSLVPERKDIPVGLMASYIECLLTNKEIKCADIDEYNSVSEEEMSIHNYLRSMGVKSTYAIAIFADHSDSYMKKKIPLGFVGIDYTRDKKELSEDDLSAVRSAAMIIKGFMLSSENQKGDPSCGFLKRYK